MKTVKAITFVFLQNTSIFMSLYCFFSSLYTIQIAPFLLMCCHTNVNKYAELCEFAVMNPQH